MKLLILLFLFGLAAATTFQDVWDRERDKMVSEFMKGMEMAGPLRRAVGMPDARELDEVEDDIKTELGKTLREAFDRILEKIKDAVDKEKDVHKDLVEEAKVIFEHLKELHISIGDKAKELVERLKEKAKDFLKRLLQKIIGDRRRSIEHSMAAVEELNLRKILEKVVEMLKERIDLDRIIEYIKEKHGKIGKKAKMILDFFIEGKGREAIIDFLNTLLNKNEKNARSLKESWEELKQRIKDFFKEKNLDLKEKFTAFFEWLKESIKNGLEVSKDRNQAIKNIVKEFLKYYREVRKEVAIEALEALRPYKEELGDLWEVFKEKVMEVLRRKD